MAYYLYYIHIQILHIQDNHHYLFQTLAWSLYTNPVEQNNRPCPSRHRKDRMPELKSLFVALAYGLDKTLYLEMESWSIQNIRNKTEYSLTVPITESSHL